MDNPTLEERLREGAARLGLALPEDAIPKLLWLSEELQRWNRKVNLTAITEPLEMVEKHLLDSLALLPEVEGARSLLDVGAGGGFPGLPLKLARPALEVVLLESQGKKVAFMKQAIARLGLFPGAKAVQERAGGHPEAEGVRPAERVVSRALVEPAEWLLLAAPYLAPGGRVLVMLGREPPREELERGGMVAGLRLLSLRSYRLPFSKDGRAVAAFGR